MEINADLLMEKKELFVKVVAIKNYKQKECSSFFERGFCGYGSRCHFKHDQRKVNEINRESYHSSFLNLFSDSFNNMNIMEMSEEALIFNTQIFFAKKQSRRLNTFKNHSIPQFCNNFRNFSNNNVNQNINKNAINLRMLQSFDNFNNNQLSFNNFNNYTATQIPMF